jgi:hypothetical protein
MITSRCDSILCSDRRIFKNIAIREPRQYCSDHYLALSILESAPLRMHRAYSRGQKHFPLQPPKWGLMTKEDVAFSNLNNLQDRKCNSWIGDITWKLIDQKMALRRSISFSHTEDTHLHQQIRRAEQRMQVNPSTTFSVIMNYWAHGAICKYDISMPVEGRNIHPKQI